MLQARLALPAPVAGRSHHSCHFRLHRHEWSVLCRVAANSGMTVGLAPKAAVHGCLAPSRPLTRLQKRRLLQQEAPEDLAVQQARSRTQSRKRRWNLALYVRWTTLCGTRRVTRLPLRVLSSLDQLQGMFSRLIRNAHRDHRLPDFMTSPEYIVCTPAEEFVSVPSALGSTHFRLVVTDEAGWEHTVAERVLAASPDPAGDLMVTLAEFQSNALDLGDHEIVFNMVSYPTVCILRSRVETVAARAAEMAQGDQSFCRCQEAQHESCELCSPDASDSPLCLPAPLN